MGQASSGELGQSHPGTGGKGQSGIQGLLYPVPFPQGGLGVPRWGPVLDVVKDQAGPLHQLQAHRRRRAVLRVGAQGLAEGKADPRPDAVAAGIQVVPHISGRGWGYGPIHYLGHLGPSRILAIKQKGDQGAIFNGKRPTSPGQGGCMVPIRFLGPDPRGQDIRGYEIRDKSRTTSLAVVRGGPG